MLFLSPVLIFIALGMVATLVTIARLTADPIVVRSNRWTTRTR